VEVDDDEKFFVEPREDNRSESLIETTYGHLLDERHRGSVVEYRVAEVVRLATERRAERA